MCLLNKSLAHPKQYRVTVLYRVCVPASPGVFLPGPGPRYRYSTGKKTPGGAGTHTGHTGHTGARGHTDHTDEPHNTVQYPFSSQVNKHQPPTTTIPKIGSKME